MEFEINKHSGRFSKRQNIKFPKNFSIKDDTKIFWKVVNFGYKNISVPKVFAKICRAAISDRFENFRFTYTLFVPKYIFAIGKEFKNEIQKFIVNNIYDVDFIFDGLIRNQECLKAFEAFFSSTEIKVNAKILDMILDVNIYRQKNDGEIKKIIDVLAEFAEIDCFLNSNFKKEHIAYAITNHPKIFSPGKAFGFTWRRMNGFC